MPTKQEWIKLIIESNGRDGESLFCPLCLKSRSYVNQDQNKCHFCVFSIYSPPHCVESIILDLSVPYNQSLNEMLTPKRVEQHKREFFLPFVHGLPEDHPFFTSTNQEVTT